MDETQVHRGGTLGALVLRACQRFADRPALVGPDRTLTYRQLAHRVGAMCLALNEAGLRRGDGVALLALNAADVVVANIAIMVAGLRLTALSPLGGEDDHVFCVGDAEISALIIDPRFAARAAAIRERAPGLHHLFALGEAQGAADLSAYADRPAPFPVDQACPTDIAMIAYTGGTTGRPKGVVHTHVSAMAALHMAAAEWEWPTNGVVMAVTPVSHAAGILAYPTFLRGGVFHVLPAFSAQGFYDYVEQHRVGATFMAPTMIYRLLDDPPSPQQDLSSLETIFYGAAPMDPNRMRQALERFGPIFMQLYGQTEAPTCISYMRRVEHVGADLATLASAGVPQAAVDLALLTPDGTPAEADGVGEICVRGAFVMQGYWRRDAETAAALAGGWLHTGDVGRFDADGRLHIVDRIKDLIITGGLNVYPREVEDVIGAMEGVRGCAVVGAPDTTWGEAVVAFVVPSAQGAVTSDEIKARVKAAKGAAYAPKEVMFLDNLPLTPVGKVDKKVLREAVRQRR